MYWIMDFCSELVLHYIPAHVCIIGNELADQYAICKKAAVARFTTQQQDEVCASLSNLKLYLNELEDWGFRQSLLEDKTPHLKLRVASPRPFQTLFSRYRSSGDCWVICMEIGVHDCVEHFVRQSHTCWMTVICHGTRPIVVQSSDYLPLLCVMNHQPLCGRWPHLTVGYVSTCNIPKDLKLIECRI